MKKRILHKVKERKHHKQGPDTIITECGEKGEVKGGWEFVTCFECLDRQPEKIDRGLGDLTSEKEEKEKEEEEENS